MITKAVLEIPSRLLLAFLWAWCPTQGLTARVLEDIDADDRVSRAIVVPAGEFSVEWAEQEARKFLQQKASRYRILQWFVGVDEVDVWRHLGGKGFVTVSYQDGVEWYKRDVGLGYPKALVEVTAVGENAVMKWRDKEGNVGRKILHGEDPLRFRLGSRDFEIAYVAFTASSDLATRSSGDDSYAVHFFIVTAEALPESRAKSVVVYLKKRWGSSQIIVEIRKDTWFLGSSQFPIVYRFGWLGEPPRRDQFVAGSLAICSSSRKAAVRCGFVASRN